MREHATVVFSGGGTGGHLYPALAIAEDLEQIHADVRVRFVGAQRGIEARVLPERGREVLLLDVEGFSRSRPLSNLPVLSKLLRAVRKTVAAYRAWHPELVVVTGGYAGAPAGVAAVATRTPVVLQEQNSWPGVTTRLLARWARQIHVAFPEAIERLPAPARDRARLTGNPVRPLPALSSSEARRRMGLAPELPAVLVAGGSQGSRALNRLVLEALAALGKDSPEFQVLWSTGPAHAGAVEEALSALPRLPWVHPVPYIEDMTTALRAVDVAVSRAGAMTTSEYLVAGLPSVLVPLPTAAADHQTHNAEALAAAGVAVHLPEREATGAALWNALLEIMDDSERRRRMAAAALERARPDATREIARSLSELLRGAA